MEKKRGTRIWVNAAHCISEWEVTPDEPYTWDSSDRLQPYSLLGHAQSLLDKSTNAHVRADAIVNLNRAVQLRIRQLNERYQFRTLPGATRKNHLIDLMAEVGCVRPVMVGRLRDLRNAIEHKFNQPPKPQVCAELAEFVWYFLRSTDALVRGFWGRFLAAPQGEDLSGYFSCGLTVELDLRGWSIGVQGWLPASLVSNEERSGWTRVVLGKRYGRREQIEKMAVFASEHGKGITAAAFRESFANGLPRDRREDIGFEGTLDERAVKHHRELVRKLFGLEEADG